MILATLHVSAAEALRACAEQPDHHPVQHEDCEKPAPAKALQMQNCCAAMTSCSVSIAIDGAADESRVIPDRTATIPARTWLLSALRQAPEPPPPKGQA